jgi:hypothetical protein
MEKEFIFDNSSKVEDNTTLIPKKQKILRYFTYFPIKLLEDYNFAVIILIIMHYSAFFDL